ncbi:alpha-E domain-containing protein [Bacillus taeanensis]|uniref:Alpha-E domain-containing protein n=1 Tax=Bacillus taeanensis TaxID=273032 RepID=A0A366XWX4_9BACI|nr:alpha-E domain-containing protein [Bacillus taeanensis]RBW69655.1 alpha-E domain-containing protein [Bacillus taeanensis]
MINRCAELLYWVGRYVERAENHTRLIDVNYHMRHELKGKENEETYMWERLITAIGDEHTFKSSHGEINETTVIQFLTFDRQNLNSIFSCLYQIRSNMRALRQLLPDELWDIVNEFYLWMDKQNIHTLTAQSPFMFYQRVREWLSLFNGTADSTMIREQEWNFIQAGKYLERAENTVHILQAIYTNFMKDGSLFVDHNHYNRLSVLLKSVGGFEAFRKCYADDVTFAKVIGFMMLNASFPRSVSFALTSMEANLRAIKQKDFDFSPLFHQSIVLSKEIDDITAGVGEESVGLEQFAEMLRLCEQLGAVVSNTFFREELIEA